MANDVTAVVTAITGKAYARDEEGELRALRAGDVLQEGDTLITPDGSSVQLELPDGSPLQVTDTPEMAITRDLV
ncbi:MAG: retention module-containing protein, partial [Halioglobus sp.]